MTKEINSPTTLTIQHFDIKVSLSINHSDIEMSQMFDLFKTAVLAIGYTELSFQNEIYRIAENI